MGKKKGHKIQRRDLVYVKYLEFFPSYRNLFSDCSKLFLFSKNKFLGYK